MQKENEKEFIHIKAILVGECGCGKTSLLARFATKQFVPDVQSTVFSELTTRSIFGNGGLSDNWDEIHRNVRVDFWDLAGNPQFYSMIRSYYREAELVFFVFDLTRDATFKLISEWKRRIDDELLTRGHAAFAAENGATSATTAVVAVAPIPCILIANKFDLLHHVDMDTSLLEAYARANYFDAYFVTSAKTGLAVEGAFLSSIVLAARNKMKRAEQLVEGAYAQVYARKTVDLALQLSAKKEDEEAMNAKIMDPRCAC
jgi:small GTP-binding protein